MSKRALLIGINYKGTSNQLSGCIDDVENAKKLLLKKGYTKDHITMMTDDTPIKPTKTNILREIFTLIMSGDQQLYIHYSGHGGSVRDTSGDEKDGKDECIFPLDSIGNWKKIILDDEWRGLLSFLKKDQNLFVVMDCCHSGTGMDLAYSLYQRFGWLSTNLQMVRDKHYSKTKCQVVMLSGCLDPQTSADAWEENQAQGALTYAFIKMMKSSKKISYHDLVLGVRKLLKSKGYAQIPTLSSGRNLNLSSSVKI